MKFTAIALSSALALASVSVTAAETSTEEVKPAVQSEVVKEQPQSENIFSKLDQNADGKISPQEAQVSPALVKSFEKIDSNKDGFLSQDEFAQLQVKAVPAGNAIALIV
ncbi:hypothetical protein [Neptuniibacter halophilus]|uniref:hypothetical protein n=1 Tax=Neptuniibacter halophilus TaxID=651666 RepID=UPI0025736AE1|nr:hypothetical protein [Neptuniibacter halophilus]